MTRKRLLLVDDDLAIRKFIKLAIAGLDFEVVEAADGRDALAKMDPSIALVLLDIAMPELDGLAVLEIIATQYPSAQVIMISAGGNLQNVVRAIKRGAFWYVAKPFEPDELCELILRASNQRELCQERDELRSLLGAKTKTAELVANSPLMQEVVRKVQRVAALSTPVLLTGESGTGKSSLARFIHQTSARATGPFVTFNCAAVPRDLIESELFGHERGAFTGAVNARPGCIELAHGGTLFLDEIGDMPLELQPKLLTVLQEREVKRLGDHDYKKVDFRLITATHQNLEDLCRKKLFREDLFFRLNVLAVRIPALRERMSDLPSLIERILIRIAGQHGQNKAAKLSKKALRRLEQYRWPGNLRELENVLERAVAFTDQAEIVEDDLTFSTLDQDAPTDVSALVGLTLREIEELAIKEALRACGGSKSKAARMLGVSEKTIYNKLSNFDSD